MPGADSPTSTARGGLTTEAVAAVDAAGRLPALAVLPGRRPDLGAARALLAALPGRPGRVVGDRGLSAAWLRADIAALGAEPCIPAQPTHPPAPFDRAAYARRNAVERFRARMKEWRGVAARYGKAAASCRGGIVIPATLDWLKG